MMPDNARGKGREPNGKQCLRRKGMKKIKSVEKHITKERINSCIGMIHIMPTALMM
jgi:hypothetical protein